MKLRSVLLGLLLISAFALAACSPQASTDTMADEKPAAESMDNEMDNEAMADDDAMMKEDGMSGDDDDMMKEDEMSDHGDDMKAEDKEMSDDDDMMKEDDMSGEDMMEEDAMMTPDWFSASLTDVKTGETFTINDYKGKVVLVETLAMWCSNCLKQQNQVLDLHGLLGERDDFVSVGIDIDPNEKADALKEYTAKNGFNWVYTVAPVEVAREISQLYGDQFLNPPSTPMLIIDRHGEVHLLPFGIKNANTLLEALQPFLDANM